MNELLKIGGKADVKNNIKQQEIKNLVVVCYQFLAIRSTIKHNESYLLTSLNERISEWAYF